MTEKLHKKHSVPQALTKRKSSAGPAKHNPPSVGSLIPAGDDLGNSLGALTHST